MSNVTFAAVLLAFTAMGVFVLALGISRRKERDASLYFILLGISNALWGIFNALFYIIPNPDLALLVFDLRLMFVCYTSIFTYLFVLKSVRHITLPLNARRVLYTIPIFTGILTLTNSWHGAVRTHISIVMVDGIRTIVNTNGLWFWVHSLVCYALMAMSLVLLIKQYLRLPSGYRFPILIMIFGLTLSSLSSLISVFGLAPYSLDIAPMIVQVTQTIFFFSLYNSHSLDVLFTSRDAIFENSNDAILVLNNDLRIMDYNKKVSEMGRQFQVPEPYDMEYTTFMEKWMEHSHARYFKEDPSIVSILQNGDDRHFQIHTTPFFNNQDKEIGSYVEIKNITPMMTLIHKLQDSAYVDHLTGLFNRRSFANQLQDCDNEESLPLGMVVGDINRLKVVNDTYGHAVGDLLLQTITNQLRVTRLPRTTWFRIGGDEFVALIPNANQQDLDEYVSDLEKRCTNLADPRFEGAGIALAFRLRTSMDQSLDDVFAQADQAMYEGKRDRRR